MRPESSGSPTCRRASLAAALLATGGAALAAPLDYRVTVTPDVVAVRACADGARAVRRWYAPGRRAAAFLLDAARSGGGALARAGGELVTRAWQDGECLDYRVDLAALNDAVSARERVAGARLAPPTDWLWRPTDADRGTPADLTFELPPGWSVTVPWASLDPLPPRRRYRFDAGESIWPMLVAFGPFPERDVVSDRGRARLALLGDLSDRQRDVLTDYVETTARDVAATFPRLFQAGPQIAVVPARRRGADAVPFGQSVRGGTVALLLYVDPERTLAEYLDSWTLHHELVHLLHPYLGDEGRWIAEGVATYYQNVVRARAGRHGARSAWRKLAEGFARGRRDHATTDLATTSRRVGETGHYMRVYWAGAALALRADVALRTRAGAPASLDAALNRFAACCLVATPQMRPREFLAALDRLVGGGPATALFDAHVAGSALPDLRATWAALGIVPDGGQLRFDADPERVALRRAIMGSDD